MNLFDDHLLPQKEGVYLVGGSVRNLLLKIPVADYDIAVSLNPEEFANTMCLRVKGRLVVMGKADQRIYRIISGDGTFDISRLKGSSIESDLMERDFTINAMAYAFSSKRIIDPLNGKADLIQKVLRMASKTAFKNDPVRLIRAFRLCSLLGFRMEPITYSALRENAHLILKTAAERITNELNRILMAPGAFQILHEMGETGLLFHILPELLPTIGCFQNQHHDFDVYTHTLKAFFHLEALQNDPASSAPEIETAVREAFLGNDGHLLKWAMLLHDIGKPAVKTTDEKGNIHFFGHAGCSADIALGMSERLKFSKRDSVKVIFLIRSHIKPLNLFMACRNPKVATKAKTRFFRNCGNDAVSIILHAIADIKGKSDAFSEQNEEFIRFAKDLICEYWSFFRINKAVPPFLNGHDLIRKFGIEPSPIIKKILNRIEEGRLTGEVRNRDEALILAKKVIDRLNP